MVASGSMLVWDVILLCLDGSETESPSLVCLLLGCFAHANFCREVAKVQLSRDSAVHMRGSDPPRKMPNNGVLRFWGWTSVFGFYMGLLMRQALP